METKQDIIQWLESNRAQFIDMADAIWRKPEIAWQETEDARMQAEMLQSDGFRTTENVGGVRTAFVAEWDEGSPSCAKTQPGASHGNK